MNTKWKDTTFVAFDTETSGAYPLDSELCEIGAVKWRSGKIIEEYQTLIKPTHLIPERIIKIHGITNEMLVKSPSVGEVVPEFRKFIDGCITIAHHAPFDLGFMALAFENAGIAFPGDMALCTSLMSRKLIPKSTNHRLQTLIKYLKIHQGTAHRALDDAKACMEVALHCFRLLGEEATIGQAVKAQGKKLIWSQYSIADLRKNSVYGELIHGIEEKAVTLIDYKKKDKIDHSREVMPIGIVRNPDGDFLYAKCYRDEKEKRFYLNKILAAKVK